MKSKYNSFCVVCRKRIMIGQEIDRDEKRDKWVHVECLNGSSNKMPQHQVASSSSSKVSLADAVEKAQDSTQMTGSTNFKPSKYQEAIFDFIQNGKGNAVVEAVAGSGKTTTIIKALELTSPKDRVAFLAFNKHIANELQSRVPEHVHASTIHSLGFAVIRKLESRPEVDVDKVGKKMDSFWPISREVKGAKRAHHRLLRGHMRKLVSLCKATLVDYEDKAALLDMCLHFGIDMNGEEPVILMRIAEVMEACKDLKTVDFDDMIWLPLVNERLKRNIDQFDFLFIDEAQDLNASQIEFVLNSLQPKTGRIVAVGDRKQSLYGFRGADVLAIPRLIEMLDAKVLPLSISYRCPKDIVTLAKTIVPQIESWNKSPKGKITREMNNKVFLQKVNPGDMVVCRTNAPLVKPAFECIRQGKKAIIRGKDIGKQLVNFVERFQATDLSTLEVLMSEYSQREYNRLLDKGLELAAEMVMDKLETIRTVSIECTTVIELSERLDMLFSDSNVGVVFSSVHRAKGLEADKVYILKEELMPHPKANKENWEWEQEQNVKYVAYTRSKNELIFVKGEM